MIYVANNVVHRNGKFSVNMVNREHVDTVEIIEVRIHDSQADGRFIYVDIDDVSHNNVVLADCLSGAVAEHVCVLSHTTSNCNGVVYGTICGRSDCRNVVPIRKRIGSLSFKIFGELDENIASNDHVTVSMVIKFNMIIASGGLGM